MKKSSLNNRYFLLRHGHSIANQMGVIVSDPHIGINGYGLTEQGINQVLTASEYFTPEDKIIIYSSDFKRAQETAEIVGNKQSIDKIFYSPLLRERFFGNYDGLDDSQYKKVWEKDKYDEQNKDNSVESPREVAERTHALIEKLELEYKNRKILLVSHGDCLQILQTVFENISPSRHRSLDHLKTAEIRQI